jgi:O-antigen/teichoic acid export membrane protein
MVSLKRLVQSRAARNAGASYVAFFSVSISAFVSIPIVVRFLDKEQIGLWTVVNQVVGYLLWMDLGVGNAAGRKLADAIAANDQAEINRWWTAIFLALSVLGVLFVGLGSLLAPFAVSLLKIPAAHQADAYYLLFGALLVAGLNFPIKGAPGFLTAQDRFHWCPIAQAIMPWVSLVIFYVSLANGFGVRSYIWSIAAAQVFVWVYYLTLVRGGPQKPSFDRSGLTSARFKSLFGYSLNLSVLSFVESLIQSLPAMILSRAGGLAMVPIYSFSAKGPLLISSLVRRTTHAFYPGLLKLHVSGQREAFRDKYKDVGIFTLAVGTCAAGFTFLGNRMLVEFLAGPDFYAGHATNLWFVVAVLSGPLCALFEILLQFSGSMGKSALVAPLKLILASVASFFLYRFWGLSGIGAVFAFVPFFYGIYSYYQGCVMCGHTRHSLANQILLTGLALIILIIICGGIVILLPANGSLINIGSRSLWLSGRGEILAGTILILTGIILGIRQVKRIGNYERTDHAAQ